MKSNAYNSHESRARTIVSENSFAKGMRYTNNPLAEGYVKSLVNFTLTNDGSTIRPRPGYQQIYTNVATMEIDEKTQDFGVYFTDNLLVNTSDEVDAVLCRCILGGAIEEHPEYTEGLGYNAEVFNTANSLLVISYNSEYIVGVNKNSEHLFAKGNDDKFYLPMQYCIERIHDVQIGLGHSRNGVHAIIDNAVYVPLVHLYSDNEGTIHYEHHIATVYMQFNDKRNSFDWWFKLIEPKDITAVQAVNYGYNMLATEPYKFVNQSTANSIPLLDGILPYDTNGKLLTSARAGAEIFFHLVYRYPIADIENSVKYRVRWSIQDLGNDSGTIVLQSFEASDVYTPGDDIYFRTTQTTYKKFTLLANVCYDTDYQTDGENAKVIATITLAYYYLTNDTDTSTLNIEANKYDLSTAQGMCTWQQRLILWGVSNAKNVLWVSEINDPSWFPYPNNCEIFPDDIVACTRYKSGLLVFTKSALYQVVLLEDGLNYSTKCIQERLTMDTEDIASIVPVQNMVFFKNGNSYYLIVPVTNSMSGELQLAPISRAIEPMFSEFATESVGLLEKLVKPTSINYYIVDDEGNRLMDSEHNIMYIKTLDNENVTFNLFDWWCILESKTLRIYYKFEMQVGEKLTYLDYVFNYDTSTRAWTTSIVNSTRYRMTPYISSVTAETIFVQPVLTAEHTISLNLIQGSELSTIDSFDIDYYQSGWSECLQYVDTGFRDLCNDIKKRFRQVQFRVNNITSATLNFYTSFIIDNDVRKQYCTFETTEVTDPDADDYGTVYVDTIMEEPDVAPGINEIRDYVTEWELDTSRFPNTNTAQVRVNVSGKGNLCRFELRSYNDKSYEISSMAWVYRPMYAR